MSHVPSSHHHGSAPRRSFRLAFAAVACIAAAVALPVLADTTTAGATTPTAPLAPTDVSATGLYEGASITFTVPDDGGDPISSFLITPTVDGITGSPATYAAGAAGSSLDPTPGAVDTAVTQTAYPVASGFTFTVAAVNAMGTGALSAPSNAISTGPTVPSAATAPTATANAAGAVTVQWTVPSNNGSAINNFIIQPYLSGGPEAPTPEGVGAVGSTLDPTPGAHDSATVSGFTAGDSYTFAVVVANGVGFGSTSPPSNAVTATAPPVVLTVSPTGNDFGSLTLGDISPDQVFTFSNNGQGTDQINNLTFGGADPDDFVLTQASSCRGLVLQPGATCTVNLAFLPGAVGERTATVTADDNSASPQVITLSGTGTEGYYIADNNGNIMGYGDAQIDGPNPDINSPAPIVSVVSTGDDGGYWLTNSLGDVYPVGDAESFGDLSSIELNKPIVGMAATPDGGGYWLVASDGGIFSFGDAAFYGSTGDLKLNQPIVGIASTPDGAGYWMVASDGGIFAFGDAPFYGSTGNIKLNKPIVGMSPTPDGSGYWLVASDGGIFAYGDAPFYGSTGNITLNKPIVGMAATPDGGGYWMVASDGGIFAYGDAQFNGSASGQLTNVVGMSITGYSTFQATVDIPADRFAAIRTRASNLR